MRVKKQNGPNPKNVREKEFIFINRMKKRFMSQERDCGTGKSGRLMILMIGVPGQGKGKAPERVVEDFAGVLQTFAKEEMAHLRAVRRIARKRQHMHLNGYVMMQPDHMEQTKENMMFLEWHSMSMKEQIEDLLGSLKAELPEIGNMMTGGGSLMHRMAQHEAEVVGLKFGKGTKLRCCNNTRMMAA